MWLEVRMPAGTNRARSHAVPGSRHMDGGAGSTDRGCHAE